MKTIKKLLMMSLFILFLGIVGCSVNTDLEEEINQVETPTSEKTPQSSELSAPEVGNRVEVKILVPSESTAMSLVHLIYDQPNLGEGIELTVKPYVQRSDPLLAAFMIISTG